MMKKYVVGCLIGFFLSLGFGAHAEVVTMINKIVEGTFPVTVQGSKLPVDAVVIEGSTYLPVRAFGEAIGYTVGFDADLGVSLSKTVTDSTYSQSDESVVENPKYQMIRDLDAQKNELQKKIIDLAQILTPYEIVSYDPVRGPSTKPIDEIYTETKKIRDEAISKRDEIEQQIKALVNQ